MKSLGAYGAAPTPPPSAAPVSATASPPRRSAPPDAVAVPQPLSAAETHAALERRLPPEPPQSDCDPETLKKVAAAVAAGQSVVGRLKNHTAFKNPEIMGQLVNFVAIEEKGSNYSPLVFDSSCAGMRDHVALAEEQNAFLQALQQQQQLHQQPPPAPVPAVARRTVEHGDGGPPATKKAVAGMEQVPDVLKPVAGLLRQARTMGKADPVLSYYMLFYAAQKALDIRKQDPSRITPDVMAYLGRLFDEIERVKQQVARPEKPDIYVTEKAFKAFVFADRQDRAGQSTKATAAAFRTAALIFETLKQFAPELPEEIASRMKYAVWRSMHIMTRLEAGEAPDPPQSSASAEEAELDELSQQEPQGALPPNVAVVSAPAAVGSPAVQHLQFFDTLNKDIAKRENAAAAQSPPPPYSGLNFPSPPGAAAPNPYGALPHASGASPGALPDKNPFAAPAPGGQPANSLLMAFPAIPGSSTSPSPYGAHAASPNPYAALSQQHASPTASFPSVPTMPHGGDMFPPVPGHGGFPPAPGHGSAPDGGSPLDSLFDLPSVPTKKAGQVLPDKPPAAAAPKVTAPQPKAAGQSKKALPQSDDDDGDDEDDAKAGASRRRPPRVQFGAQPGDFVPKAGDVAVAQKLTKTAFSALNFDDTTTAVRDLCIALRHLTGTDFQLTPNK